MTLHLIEQPLSLRALHLWAGTRGLGEQFDEGLALHQLLAETFGPGVLQPFRLMVAPRAQTGTIYAYSTSEAEALRRQAVASLTPAHAGILEIDRLRSLPRPTDTWSVGQRLGFDLRARPVVRLASALSGRDGTDHPVSFRKGAEVDAFLATVLRGTPSTREAVYLAWLSQRLGTAAELDIDTTRLASFQRSRVQRNGRRLDGPDIILHGTLAILDPQAFAALLAKGVGRHRSYGYGMLLLRPPQRAG